MYAREVNIKYERYANDEMILLHLRLLKNVLTKR